MSIRKDKEQKRAKKAFEFAEDQKKSDKYESHVQKIPAMIRSNGLGNTLLFMKTGDEAWKCLYKQVGTWLYDQGFTGEEKEDPLKYILNLKDNEADVALRAMTHETLAMLNWLRRFVKKI